MDEEFPAEEPAKLRRREKKKQYKRKRKEKQREEESKGVLTQDLRRCTWPS